MAKWQNLKNIEPRLKFPGSCMKDSTIFARDCMHAA